MMAIKLRMKPGQEGSRRTQDIQAIYLTGCANPGYFETEALCDYLDYNPGYVQVNVRGYPALRVEETAEGRRLRSTLNPQGIDHLFSLPQE